MAVEPAQGVRRARWGNIQVLKAERGQDNQSRPRDSGPEKHTQDETIGLSGPVVVLSGGVR